MREGLSQHEVLEVFRKQPERTFRIRELVRELGLRSSQAHELKHVLNDLSKRRRIRESKKSHFTLAPQRSHGKGTDQRTWPKGRKVETRTTTGRKHAREERTPTAMPKASASNIVSGR